LAALSSLPTTAIHYGNFLVAKKWAGLVRPPDFRPPFALPTGAAPEVAYVWKTEEKGSDVNLGVHPVRDALQGRFEAAALLTNDTDLTEAVRIVVEEAGLPVVLLAPAPKPATSLARYAVETRHITGHLGAARLPDVVRTQAGRLIPKPLSW
jgi:hypothetical protein